MILKENTYYLNKVKQVTAIKEHEIAVIFKDGSILFGKAVEFDLAHSLKLIKIIK